MCDPGTVDWRYGRRQRLARIDEEGMAADLESSNPANNHRYQRHGFEQIGEFYPPGGKIPVATMSRDAR